MAAAARALGVAVTVLVVGACGNLGLGEAGSGRLETVEPDVPEYSRLVAESSFRVTVRAGDGYDLVVRADDNVIDDVSASVSGGALTLGLAGRYRDVTLEAEVEVPADGLTAIGASGASQVVVPDRLLTDAFDVDASGASEVTLQLETDELTASASGASTVEVTGTGGRLEAAASGSSTLSLGQFVVATARARADGASTIELTTSDALEAKATGASTIRYGGNPPEVSSDESGASTIEPS